MPVATFLKDAKKQLLYLSDSPLSTIFAFEWHNVCISIEA